MFVGTDRATVGLTDPTSEGVHMSASTIDSPTAIHRAREHNHAVWKQSAEALYAQRVEEFLAFWHDDARYEVAYPIDGMPAIVEGKAALAEIFGGFCAASREITVSDVRFHQTDDPGVALIEETMTIRLQDGGWYRNRLILRVTFVDGLISEVLEYYGELKHLELLRRLGFAR